MTGEQRDRLAHDLLLFGHDGATMAALAARWSGPRVAQVLDELVGGGDVAGKGRRKAKSVSTHEDVRARHY